MTGEDLMQMAADFADLAESLYREALSRESSHYPGRERISALLRNLRNPRQVFFLVPIGSFPRYRDDGDSSPARCAGTRSAAHLRSERPQVVLE